LTRDAIFDGRITLVQPRTGYRFGLDSLLLADFAQVGSDQTVVDLGTGVGVIALALARRMGRGRVLAVEVQPRLAECARINAAENACGSLVQVLAMDWVDLTPNHCPGPVDLVVSNPPYRALGTGRVNPDQEEAGARHEIHGSAATVAQTAAGILKAGGRLAVIYPAARLIGLVNDLKAAGFEPKRLRLVHSRPGEKARLAMVEAGLGGGEELEVLPPMFVNQKEREYSAEVRAILAGETFGGTKKRPGPL